jgi:hypothetical protein
MSLVATLEKPNPCAAVVDPQTVHLAELAITRRAATMLPIVAEISGREDDENRAGWYLLQTHHGEDAKALRFLARRHFGVFRPMEQKRERNALVQGWQPILPGCLFVFCWDIAKMRARLEVCPGVHELFCDPATNKPVPIDQCDDEGVPFVTKLWRLSQEYLEEAPRQRRFARHAANYRPRALRCIRRPSRQERRHLDRLKFELKHRGYNRDHEIWTLANGLDPHLRIALLRRTLTCAPPFVGDPGLLRSARV